MLLLASVFLLPSPMRVSFIVILLLSLVCLALAASRPQKALAFKAKHNANAHIPRFRRQEVAEEDNDPAEEKDAPPAAPVAASSASVAAPANTAPGGPIVTPPDVVSCNDCKAVLSLFNTHLQHKDKTGGLDDDLCSTVSLCPAPAAAAAVPAASVPDKAADKQDATHDAATQGSSY